MAPSMRFPVYIPSKGRARIVLTPRALDDMGVSYRIIVEAAEHADYAAVYGAERLLVLDRAYQDSYETLDDRGYQLGKGAGPARNFAWDHSASEGHDWHWVMDDNIAFFGRLHANVRRRSADALPFTAMEDFTTRYLNTGMAGPEYEMFLPSRCPVRAPYKLNRRVFSCNLIRNATGLRWRGRYNEDLILSLDMVSHGWCTITFKAFCQKKMSTQMMAGGNTSSLYGIDGTLEKSRMAVRAYPEYVRLVERYGRAHHYVDWSAFRDLRLIRDPAWQPPAADPYRTRVVTRQSPLDKHARPGRG